MSKPLVVSLPHNLGQDEAVRRLKTGLGSARTQFGGFLSVEDETWTGNNLAFRVTSLGQAASGTIDVQSDHVVLTVTLPWLLQKFAEAIRGRVEKQGQVLLEKKPTKA